MNSLHFEYHSTITAVAYKQFCLIQNEPTLGKKNFFLRKFFCIKNYLSRKNIYFDLYLECKFNMHQSHQLYRFTNVKLTDLCDYDNCPFLDYLLIFFLL